MSSAAPEAPDFRQRAEAEFRLMQAHPGVGPDLVRLIEDIQIYQIELRLRNEELMVSNNELAELKRSGEMLFDDAPVGYLTLSEEGVVRQINEAAIGLLSRDRAEVVGAPLRNCLAPGSVAVFDGLLRTLGGSISTADLEFDTPTADRFVAKLDCRALPSPNGSLHVLATLTDVSVARTAARSMQASNDALSQSQDEAHGASRVKSAFLASMSHEMRTPLNAILGMAYILGRSGLGDDQRVKLGKIQAAGRHLLNLVSNVLDISKVEAGKLTLENRGFDVGQMIERTVDMVSEAAQTKGLDVAVEMAGCPAVARGG